MLNKDVIREFRLPVQKAFSNYNFSQFCKAAGVANDAHGEALWFQFQNLSRGLAAFDDTTLLRLLTAEAPKKS